MPAPLDHARRILDWFGERPVHEIVAELPPVGADEPLLASADALAEAADSDDEDERRAGIAALFGELVEGLGDGFTPAGRAVYARFFGRIVWRCAERDPELRAGLERFGIDDEAALLQRHHRVRTAEEPATTKKVRRIVVLSRVTIGADVLLTTVLLQRLLFCYPRAELVLLGDAKLAGLIGGLPGLRIRALKYPRRGPLRERLRAWLGLVDAIDEERPDLVCSPDSRLDQLGLLPVTSQDDRYLLWEGLQSEDGPARSLAHMLDDWCQWRLPKSGGHRMEPRLVFDTATRETASTLRKAFGRRPLAAVKLDHGGNPAKALPRAAELRLLRHLRERGWRVLLDRGFGAEELARNDELLRQLDWRAVDIDDSDSGLGRPVARLRARELFKKPVIRFHGSIAGWAAALRACKLSLSYDSVGQHLAAACGVPGITVFTGYGHPRFTVAWQPQGPGPATSVCIPSAEKNDPARWQTVLDTVPEAG